MPAAPSTPDTGVRENGQPVVVGVSWYDQFTQPGHTHVDERGIAVRCYHQCRTALASWGFWLGVTISFPLEHLLWERLWPFKLLTKALGL